MSKAIVVEGATLDICRAMAAHQLGVPQERLRIEVVQEGKRGLFTVRPFRVRAELADDAPGIADDTATSSFLSKLDIHVKIAMAGMQQLDVLQGTNEGRTFNEMLVSYDKLTEERRKELTDLSKLLSGPAAKRVQEVVARDGWFSLHVTVDKFSATLDVNPPEGMGRPVTLQMVVKRLAEEGIVHGVDRAALAKMLEEVASVGQPVKGFFLAKGTPAEPGINGRVEFYAEGTGKEEQLRADGSVDHRGKARITMVKAGQVLARLIPPTPGKPGANIFGQEIKPEAGIPAGLEASYNVAFDTGTGEYRSEIDGLLDVTNDRISVRRTFVVPGDVDMATGNIEFSGAVQVMGSVLDGFSVKATQDIEVHGRVEGCEIISKHGSIRVRQGIAGRNRCFVSAGESIDAHYIENARVYARKDVQVDVAIMHSEVVAGNSVLATRGKGAIIGGTIKAGNLVQARTLGAPNEPLTDLLVGIGIEEQDRIREMDQRLTSLRNAAHKLEVVIREFEHASKDVQNLPTKEKDSYVDLRKKLLVLHYEIDKQEVQRKEFVDKIAAEARGTVRASSEVYGRVVIRIGQFIDRVDSALVGTAFRADVEKGHIVRGR